MTTAQGDSAITPNYCHNCDNLFFANNNVCTSCESHNVEEARGIVIIRVKGDVHVITTIRPFNAFIQPLESEGPHHAEQHEVDLLPNSIIGADDLS